MSAEQILLSADHFRLTVQLIADRAMFLPDAGGVVKTWNLGAERIKGYRADEIVGQHFGRLYTDDDANRSKPHLALQIASERGRFEEEGWRRRRDGTLFWAAVRITALHDERQRPVGFAKVTEDLGERHAAEVVQRAASSLARPAEPNVAPVADAERILFAVLQRAQEALLLTDLRGVAVVASAVAEQLLGVRRGFFARRCLINVVARQDTRAFRALLEELSRSEVGATHTRVLRLRSRTGGVFAASARVTRVDATLRAALHWTLCPVAANPPTDGP